MGQMRNDDTFRTLRLLLISRKKTVVASCSSSQSKDKIQILLATINLNVTPTRECAPTQTYSEKWSGYNLKNVNRKTSANVAREFKTRQVFRETNCGHAGISKPPKRLLTASNKIVLLDPSRSNCLAPEFTKMRILSDIPLDAEGTVVVVGDGGRTAMTDRQLQSDDRWTAKQLPSGLQANSWDCLHRNHTKLFLKFPGIVM